MKVKSSVMSFPGLEENSAARENYCSHDAKGHDRGKVLVPLFRDPLSIPLEEINFFFEILKLVDQVNQLGRNSHDCPILAEFVLL